MEKDIKFILFVTFRILMKFLPSLLTYLTASTAGSYDEHPFIIIGIFYVFFCYAFGSCIWDYFEIKKIRAGEQPDFIPMLAIDVLLLTVAVIVFINHFRILAEVWGYDNFFKFLKDYFNEYFKNKYYGYKYRNYFAFFQILCL